MDSKRTPETRIPTLAGIKYSSMDVAKFQACVEHDNGRFDIREELPLEGRRLFHLVPVS